jgi:hypothetical protein
MAERVTATISGHRFDLERAGVEQALQSSLPEPIHDHFVIVGGRRYPPKQVICEVTGLDRADFTTHQARRILRKLDFLAARRSDPPLGTASTAEAESAYAEALRPFAGRWVATSGDEVLVDSDSPGAVVAWLNRHGRTADSIFRVPESDAHAGGAGPL